MAGIGERILIQKLCSMSVTEVGIATRQFPRRILARDWIVSAMSASGRTVPLVEGRKRAHRAPAPFRIDWISRQAGILDLEQTGAYNGDGYLTWSSFRRNKSESGAPACALTERC